MSRELQNLKERFTAWVIENGYYPNASDPALCYMLDVELGLDPRQIARDGFTKKSYRVFLLDGHGERIISPKGEVLTVTRKFTPEQRKMLSKWWPVLFPYGD